MTRVKLGLYLTLLLALVVHVLWLTLENVWPYALIAFALISLYGWFFKRKW